MVAAAVVFVVLLGSAAKWGRRRGRGGDASSVDDYRQTLQTLKGIRSAQGGVRRVPPSVDGSTQEGNAQRSGTTPPRGPSGPPRARGPLMFDDTDRRETVSGQTTLSHRREARAISRMDHRPRRFGSLTLVAGTVVVVAIALVIIGSTHHHSPNATGATRGSSATTGSTTGSRGSTATTGSSKAKGKTKGSSKTKAPATTTTLPASFVPEGGATALTATYATPSTFTLALDATVGNCWVNVTSLSGASLLTQTIPAGQQKTVAVTGGATLVIGAPNAIHVLVQGRAVQLPPGYQTPFTMTFQPPTSSQPTSSQPGTSSQSGTSSSSTTTTTGG